MQTDDMKDPQSIQALLDKTPNSMSLLSRLLSKAQLLLKIDQLLPEIVDEKWVAHCHVMNLRDQTLVIEVDNAAIATRLRYLEREILAKLQSQVGLGLISRIQLKGRPSHSLS